MPRISEAFAQFYLWLQDATGLSEATLDHLLSTFGVVLVLGVIRVLLIRLINKRTTDVRSQYQWRKTASYTVVVIGFLLVGRIWIDEFGELGTFLGLLSAGIAIALKDPITNVAGWGFIVWRRPFGPGDRIEIRGIAGDVIDQRIFQFTLLEIGTPTGAAQSTGRIIHIPNGMAFTEPVINYTRGFPYIWNEIPIVVTFESAWRDAKEILFRIAQERAEELSPDAERKVRQAAQEFMIFYSKLTPTVYTSVVDVGIQFTIRYLVEPRRRRGSEEVLWEAILDAFDARDDIDFAYPTMRYFHNVTEGKPGARAEPRGFAGNGGARSEERGVEDGGPSRE
ncbi:MAG: mechanosensitive ion channel family protein [Rhodothermales bacterium]